MTLCEQPTVQVTYPMPVKKKKPDSSQNTTRKITPSPTMPAPSSAGTQPSSSTPYPALQNDYNLLDSWLKTQATPESVLKSWENIKKNSCTNEAQSTKTQSLPTGLTNKIFQELENISKRLDKQESKPSYAQAVQKHIPAQIPLAPRILKEVLVHPGNQTPDMANRTHIQLFQALQDRLPSPYNKQVRAVRKLPSGDILINTETQETKSFLEKDSAWISAIFTKEATIQPKRFPVLIHGVRTTDIQPENLEKTRQTIQNSNPSLSKQITILRAYWSKKAIAQKKPVTSLHLDLATPEQANLLIESGVVLGHRLHEAEPFLANTVVAQCFKCFGYGHQARLCRNQAVCGACGGQHERRTCQIPEQLLKPKCSNCKGAHPAWASTCPVRQEAVKKAREAWISRPGKYEISTATTVPVTQSPVTFPFIQTLPGGKRRKTTEPTRSSERFRGGSPEVQILSTRSTNTGGKQSVNPFKIFEDEMST